MKVKVILKSLLFSYAVTGAFLLLLAFLLFQFDLGEKPVSAGIVAVYILSCFSGGFMSGKILRKDKYLWGILVGAFYYLLLITVSFVGKMGNESGTCSNYFFYVSGWWCSWWDVVLERV